MNGFSSRMIYNTLALITSTTATPGYFFKPWLAGHVQAKLGTAACEPSGDDFIEIVGNGYESQEILNGRFTTEIYPDPELGTVSWWLSGDSIEFPRATPADWGVVAQLGFFGFVPDPTYLLAGAELVGPPSVLAGERMVFLSGTTRDNSSIVLKVTTQQ